MERRGRFVGDIVVIVGYGIVGVVLFGFVVVDDGVIADVGNGFVVFVDGSVLGVNVGQISAVVLVDVAVPGVVIDGDFVVVVYVGGSGDAVYYDGVEVSGIGRNAFCGVKIGAIKAQYNRFACAIVTINPKFAYTVVAKRRCPSPKNIS